jgi:4a-hydroxytetrahydrobiopterin dehydratase
MPDTYTPDKIKQRLHDHPNWRLGDDGQLHADFEFDNFMQNMLFVNAVAHLAQTADHHPDLFVHSYSKLTISLMSHKADGITDNDFDLIAQIDQLPRP